MAEFNLSNATTTDFANTVPDFIVAAKALDIANIGEETPWYFTETTKNFGYLFGIPEIWSAASALATYTVGAGWTVSNSLLKQELLHVVGYGKDSFSKMIWSHLVTKWIIGDSFIEVKRKNNIIVNMLPISPERVRLITSKKTGRLKRYDAWNGGDWRPIELKNMLHSQNKKIGDSIHGTSMLDPLRFAVDMKNEMMEDERTIKHRDKALGIAEYQTNNQGKISFANAAIEKAVKTGEMLGISAGTVKILPWPSKGSEDRQAMIQYLEGFIYQNFGVRKGMITSEGNEGDSKMDNVNFIPIHGKERKEMEEDLMLQQQIEIKFGEPDNLGGLVAENEAKNTGQINIQPNDVEASLTRE